MKYASILPLDPYFIFFLSPSHSKSLISYSIFHTLYMRILGELPQPGFKISVFKTDSRILLKIEDTFLEQTYKFRETEGLANLSDVQKLLTEDFLAAIRATFDQMRAQHSAALQAHLQMEEEDFPTII